MFHLPMSKLTIKSEMQSRPLEPTWDPLKWQRLRVRTMWERTRGTPSLWVPFPWAHTILQPSVLA